MVSEPERFNQVVLDWLDGVADTAPKEEGEEPEGHQTPDQVVTDERVAT